MKEHFCTEHNTEFVKHKGKYGEFYSHKIEGTEEWCNEKKKQEEKQEEHFKADPEKQASIERQNAYSGLIQLMVAGIIKKEEPLGKEIIGYGAQKLNLGTGILWEAPQPQKEPVKKQPEKKDLGEDLFAPENKPEAEFKTVGEFYSTCLKLNKVLLKSAVDKELLNSKEKFDLTKSEDRIKAYQYLEKIYKKGI